VLIEVSAVRGRTVTAWPSVGTDLANAGANMVDEEVVVDEGIVSSRSQWDLPALWPAIVEEFARDRPSGWRRERRDSPSPLPHPSTRRLTHAAASEAHRRPGR
jgi:DJ-1/PfpI family protein